MGNPILGPVGCLVAVAAVVVGVGVRFIVATLQRAPAADTPDARGQRAAWARFAGLIAGALTLVLLCVALDMLLTGARQP